MFVDIWGPMHREGQIVKSERRYVHVKCLAEILQLFVC
jgi:hypothetical protein